MASVFEITPVTDKLKAETGSATAVFTVTNSTSSPLRGFAKIRPMGNTQAQWLTIEGETERDFPAGGTHQFTVAFNKPKPATQPNTPQPAESFQFRLDAISAVNPGDDFTEGPVVTVEIPEQKGGGGVRWWMIAVGAAVLLIVGGVVAFLLLRNGGDSNVEVPDVRSKTLADAQQTLAERKFRVEPHEEEAPTQTLDVVFKQEPVGKVDTAPEETTVKLTVPAKATVPPVKNMTLDNAIKALQKAGLRLGTFTGEADAIKNGKLNTVESQDPLASSTVNKGSEVNLKFQCVPQQFPGPLPIGKRCINITGTSSSQLEVDPNIKKQVQSINPKFKF